MVAALSPPWVDIALLDDDVEKVDDDKQADLVGLSLLTSNAKRGYEIAKRFREKGVAVVLGGMHVTACPEEASQHADAVVIGEAEDTWPGVIRDYASGRLQKIYRSTNSSDLANLPFPRRDLLKIEHYATTNAIQASRGCPFNCEFCSITAIFGNKIRYRPIEEVVEEIQSLPGRNFVLSDDNLAQNFDYYKELFRRIIPLRKKWGGNASWNIAKDNELLKLMQKSGCRGILIGFESLSPQAGVKKIIPSKNLVSLYGEAVKRLHDNKIAALGAFIFGFDHDTEEVFAQTLNFALSSRLDGAQLNILVPYPGTPLFKRLEAEGRITERDWSNYMSYNLCFHLKNMSRQVFLEKFLWMKKKYYSFPQIARRVLRAGARRATVEEMGLLLAINLGSRKGIRRYSPASRPC